MAKFMTTRHSNSKPPPPALAAGETFLYCHTCGRVIAPRKSHQKNPATPAKYCSDRCRNHKPRKGGVEQKIEQVFVDLLSQDITGKELGVKKGERRRIVLCTEAEEIAFDRLGAGGKKMTGRSRKMKQKRAKREAEQDWQIVGMASSTSSGSEDEASVDGNLSQSPGQDVSEGIPAPLSATQQHIESAANSFARHSATNGTSFSNPSASLEPTAEQIAHQEGQQRAEERELVRQAARRGVNFGFVVDRGDAANKDEGRGQDDEVRRKVEAVQNGKVVDASLAKGEWGVRWRERE